METRTTRRHFAVPSSRKLLTDTDLQTCPIFSQPDSSSKWGRIMAHLAWIRGRKVGRLGQWEMGHDFAIIPWMRGPSVAISRYPLFEHYSRIRWNHVAHFLATLEIWS